MKKWYILIILSLFFFFGIFLRLYKLDEGLIFTYDQARDAYRALEIVQQGNLKLLGPETDIRGVHHGVGYYYLLALLYGIKNDPVFVTAVLATIQGGGVFLIYAVAKKLFQNRQIALISSILQSVSVEMVQYSRWLSNPSLAILLVLAAVYSIRSWMQGSKTGFVFALFFIALSLHFQFFLIYLFLIPLSVFFIYRPPLTTKTVLLAVILVLAVLVPFIISELKFNFQLLHAFRMYFLAQTESYSSVSDFLQRYFERFISVSFHTVLPLTPIFAFVVIVLGVILLQRTRATRETKRSLQLIWLYFCASFLIFSFSSGALNAEFSFVGVVPFFILLAAYCLHKIFSSPSFRIVGIITFLFIITVHVRFNLIHAPDGAYIFSVQKSMTYGREKQVIDYTYNQANGKPFSICTLTNPLFVNTTWSYLYETYGKNRYGYVPYWSGPNQTYLLSYLPEDTVKPPIRYLIYEQLTGIPPTAAELFPAIENMISTVEKIREFGDFKVEMRRFLSESEKALKSKSITKQEEKMFQNQAYLSYHCFH